MKFFYLSPVIFLTGMSGHGLYPNRHLKCTPNTHPTAAHPMSHDLLSPEPPPRVPN